MMGSSSWGREAATYWEWDDVKDGVYEEK